MQGFFCSCTMPRYKYFSYFLLHKHTHLFTYYANFFIYILVLCNLLHILASSNRAICLRFIYTFSFFELVSWLE